MKLHIDNFGMLWCDKKIIASFNPIIRYQKKAMQDAQTIAHRVNCFEELRDALQMICDSGASLADPIEHAMIAALERAKT